MKALSKLVAALLATALAFLISPVLPASSSALPSYESRLSVVFSKTETGSGQSRTVTYTAVVTDSLGQLVSPGTNITGQQIRVSGMDVDLCKSEPLPRVAGFSFPADCEKFSVPTTDTGTGSTLTISESYTGQNLVTFESYLAEYPIEVPLVGFTGPNNELMLIMSSSRSLGAPAAETAAAPENDPGVSYAGFLISSVSGRNVTAETPGTLRFAGKRLNQVTGATIGGIAVTVTSAARSALVIDFDGLPAGKHDVVLTSKSGAKTTLRGFMGVN